MNSSDWKVTLYPPPETARLYEVRTSPWRVCIAATNAMRPRTIYLLDFRALPTELVPELMASIISHEVLHDFLFREVGMVAGVQLDAVVTDGTRMTDDGITCAKKVRYSFRMAYPPLKAHLQQSAKANKSHMAKVLIGVIQKKYRFGEL